MFTEKIWERLVAVLSLLLQVVQTGLAIPSKSMKGNVARNTARSWIPFRVWKLILLPLGTVLIFSASTFVKNELRQEASVIPFQLTSVGDDNKEYFKLRSLTKSIQEWEHLVLYAQPNSCDAKQIGEHWLPGSRAFLDVMESASRLQELGLHVGGGSKLLQFEFRHVRISPDRRTAEVGTRERWIIEMHDSQQTLARTADIGPFEVNYSWVKIEGRWFLERTNSPYVKWKPKTINCTNMI